MMKKHWLVLLCAVALYLPGCVIGYDSTLFVTQSNVGLNVGTKPPIFEMSIARREGVIAPGFEGGQTPPVMASFRTDSNPFSRFFFGVKSTFAGGDAAVALSQVSKVSNDNSAVCLSERPKTKTILGVFDVSIPEKGAVEPFLFGTDTTFGLKVTWGTSGEFPDSVRLGFNRTEFAWAPVFGTDVTKCKIPGTKQDGSERDGTYAVWMPPFLAVLDNDVQLGSRAQTGALDKDVKTGTPDQTGVKWLQYFATGKSATTLASQNEVRKVMMERMDPAVTYPGTLKPISEALLKRQLTLQDKRSKLTDKNQITKILTAGECEIRPNTEPIDNLQDCIADARDEEKITKLERAFGAR